jgi:hypothetical protein
MRTVRVSDGDAETSQPKADRVGRPESNFGNRQAQAGQKQLAVLGVSQKAGVRDHDRAYRTQPRDNLSRLGEASHMRIAGGKIAIGYAAAEEESMRPWLGLLRDTTRFPQARS